ncbi:hypothetical protein ACFQ0B_04765 [Nonomuraea thailandensis]
MRYARAVERLRMLAEACEQTRRLPAVEPFLREAHVFGALTEGRTRSTSSSSPSC